MGGGEGEREGETVVLAFVTEGSTLTDKGDPLRCQVSENDR